MWLQKKFNLPVLTIVLFSTLLSCQPTQTIDQVESTFPNGDRKSVISYTVQGDDTIPNSEMVFHKDGSLSMKGNLDADGKRHGAWKAYFPDSTLWSEGAYLHGKNDGKRTVWYENGQKRYEGSYKDGKEVGLWKFWDRQGKLEKEVNYDK